jgi:hypothetical protein
MIKYEKNINMLQIMIMFLNSISANYPDTHGGVDMCIVADLNGAWINYNCDHLMAFVCEVVAGFEQPTTAPPPTDAPDIDCHDGETDGWIRRPGTSLWHLLSLALSSLMPS